MARTKTYEYRKRLYSEIPAEVVQALGLKSGDELEFQAVAGRVGVIVPVSASAPVSALAPEKPAEAAAGKRLSGEEEASLQKISSIKYYDRLAEDVLKKLSQREREVFDALLKRKVFFKYIKNRKEFIGVSRDFFPSAKPAAGGGLLKDGFAVLETQTEADRLLRELEKANIPAKGIRGFDRKYYLMTEEKLRGLEKKIERLLTREKSLKTIVEELGETEAMAKAALEILREEGSIIEKKRDTYALA